MKHFIILAFFAFLLSCYGCSTRPPLEDIILDEMSGRTGTFVMLDCSTDDRIVSDTVVASERLPPCSTFKIWNTLIGVECGILSSPDEEFYTWDGVTRPIPGWNKNLTLREAFQASSVPAYQDLARRIGKDSMNPWIDRLDYGDKNISSGIDDFWLPRAGKTSIVISPVEQAQLLRRLVNHELPFSDHALNVLRDVMQIRKTSGGTFYGKTGSGSTINNDPVSDFGWFVGYVSGGERTYVFACLVKGKDLTGRDARLIVESVLQKGGLL